MKEARHLIVPVILLAVNACTQPVETKSPAGYDLNNPEELIMPAGLQEISGFTFKNGNPDTLYAQQDEEGKVFLLKPGDTDAKIIKFGKKGDYEDIGIYNDTVVLLRSDGTMYLFSLKDTDNGEAEIVREIKEAVPPGEYEAMYVDEKDGTIYILCKECPGTKKGKELNGYKISLSATGEKVESNFVIDEKQLEEYKGGRKVNLKPSAITKNTATGEWFILSSVNKMLVVTDESWMVKAVYTLAPASVFPQPEGIAFDNNHNLYISNEGEGLKSGTILKFLYKK